MNAHFLKTRLRPVVLTSAFVALLLASPAHAQHDAHVHGEAEMTIAWASQMLVVELSTPAYNLFGKPAPEDEADFAKLDALKSGDWVRFVEEINCPVTAAEISHPFEHAHDGHDEKSHEDEHDTAHNDVDVSLTHHCSYDPSALDFSALFSAYPELHEVQVQWLTDSQQSATKLHADAAVLKFQ